MPNTPTARMLDDLARHLDSDPDRAVEIVRQLYRLEADAGDRAAAIRARTLLARERAA